MLIVTIMVITKKISINYYNVGIIKVYPILPADLEKSSPVGNSDALLVVVVIITVNDVVPEIKKKLQNFFTQIIILTVG